MKRPLLLLGILGLLGAAVWLFNSKNTPETTDVLTAPTTESELLPSVEPVASEMPVAKTETATKVSKLKPLDYRQIQDLVKDGKIDEAIRLLQEDLEEDPNDGARLTELGRLLLEVPGREQEALKTFERAVAVNTENQMAVEGVLGTYYKLKDVKGATEALSSLVGKYPESAAISQSYAQLLSDQGRNRDAVPYFEKALSRSEPGNRDYLVSELAQAYAQTGEFNKAIDTYQKVIAAKEKEILDANVSKDRAAQMEKSLLTTRLDMVDAQIRSGKFQEAEQLLMDLNRRYPGDTDVASLMRNLAARKK